MEVTKWPATAEQTRAAANATVGVLHAFKCFKCFKWHYHRDLTAEEE